MNEHSEALKHIEWLHEYCNRHCNEAERKCTNCIFSTKDKLDDGSIWYCCQLNSIATEERIYQKEILPTLKRKVAELG